MSASQETFDKIQHLLHTAKQEAVAHGDAETWNNLDNIYWLLLKSVYELSTEISKQR
jgi:hypothetical protein